MIKIPKRPSYRVASSPARALSPFAFALQLSFVLAFFFIAPVLIQRRNGFFHPAWLLPYLILSLAVVVFFVHAALNRQYRLRFELQGSDERSNLLRDENAKLLAQCGSLESKIRRYEELKEVLAKINQTAELEAIAAEVVAAASRLVGEKGSSILYLVEEKTQRLHLHKTKKHDPSVVIKSKEGDIFDMWVMRHSAPLFIKNARDDFRFDFAAFAAAEDRPLGSLIAAPLISEHRFLGILRLESPEARFFSLDDLRLLVTISDLAAVALENGLFFQKTQELATHDGLTSLYTKGYFLDRLREEQKRALRQRSNLCLMMLDIDHFKKYNDTFGHVAGDLMLKTVSGVLVSFIHHPGAMVARFGGEEFCVLLPRLDKQEAHRMAEAVRSHIAKTTVMLRHKETAVTVSIGVAAFPADAGDEHELVMKADKAMYEAKGRGRNRVIDAS